MDQKRAMLYPQVDFNTPSAPSPTPTRELPHPMGLPVEAPPSYDVAVAVPALPAPAVPVPMVAPPSQPVIVAQPGPQPSPTVVQTPDELNLGPNRSRVLCPACGAQKTTRMTYTANNRTHIGAGLLCLVGWCCCACFVPYCMKSCRTANHYCRKCNTFLGSYTPKGR